ncbi:hypothetical protein HDF09_003186 [Edaphobacter lichenicola]|uniref:Uncharacterized protein n=1 Tax=Tunturiibacter empetritectus TaxID=3069691 RepID=A0A7W8IJZ7_9BACT|nr:hypothetical protein [Edaphobacter lichenicola]
MVAGKVVEAFDFSGSSAIDEEAEDLVDTKWIVDGLRLVVGPGNQIGFDTLVPYPPPAQFIRNRTITAMREEFKRVWIGWRISIGEANHIDDFR